MPGKVRERLGGVMTTALRPLSTGELLDRTFSLYRSHFGLFIGIFALPHLIVFAFQCVGVTLQNPANPMANVFLTLMWSLAALILTVIVAAASQAATVVAVSDVHLGRPASVVESFSRVKGHIPGVIGVSMLVGLGVGAGLIALIVPGVLLALMWSLAVPVKVLEDKSATDAMSRSADLTKGDRGRIFVVWLLFIVLSIGISMLIQMPIRYMAGVSSRTALHRGWQVASLTATFISQCLVGPLATIAFSLVYYDERVRKEAFDLQLMMTTIDASSLSASPTQVGA
jgi:glycerophosphoryl diester phosphodiesterase family protein